MFAELRNDAFRKLWLSQVVSEIGDWAARLALTTLIYKRTGSAEWAALMAVSSLLPMLGPGQLLASFADRMDRRVILIAADGVRAVIFAILAVAPLSTPALLWLSIAAGLATVPFEAARSAATLDVTPPERLPAAMALGQATQSLALVIGWASGGLLLTFLGVSGALAVNAGTFVLSASFLLRLPSLRPRIADDAEPGHSSPVGRLKAAAGCIARDPLVRRAAAVAVFAVGPATAVETLVVPYVGRAWPATPSLAAVILTGGAAADLLLTIVVSSNRSPESLLRIAAWCAAAPAAVAVVLFSTGVASLGALGFVVSALALTAIAPASAALAPRLPATLRASSFTVLATALTLMQVILSTSGGAVADRISDPAAASWLLALPIVVGVVALLRPVRRPVAETVPLLEAEPVPEAA